MYALTGQHCHGAINGIVKSLMFEEMNVSRGKISKEFHCLYYHTSLDLDSKLLSSILDYLSQG